MKIKVIDSRLLAVTPTATRMRVCWEQHCNWFERLLYSEPPIRPFSLTYEREGDRWNCSGVPCPRSTARLLSTVEAMLLLEQVTAERSQRATERASPVEGEGKSASHE